MPHHPKPYTRIRAGRKIWYVTIDKREHTLGDNEKRAFRLYHELMSVRGTRRAVSSPPEQITVIELCERWFDTVLASKVAFTTSSKIQCAIKAWIDGVGGKTRCGDVTLQVFDRWVREHSNLSNSTLSGYGAIIKRVWRWGAEEGLIQRNQLSRARPPAMTRRDRIIDKETYERMKANTVGAFADLLTIVWETGCRPSEAIIVEARHIDLEAGWWYFPPSQQKTGRVTGDPRVVYLTDTAKHLCRRLMKEHPEGPIFRKEKGAAWTKCDVYQKMRRVRQKLSLPKDVVLYTLRHTWITDALASGMSPEDVRIMAGHASLAMLKNYSHLAQRRERYQGMAERVRPSRCDD